MYAQNAHASGRATLFDFPANGSSVELKFTVSRSNPATSRIRPPVRRVRTSDSVSVNKGANAQPSIDVVSSTIDGGTIVRARNPGAGRTISYQSAAATDATSPYEPTTAGAAART